MNLSLTDRIHTLRRQGYTVSVIARSVDLPANAVSRILRGEDPGDDDEDCYLPREDEIKAQATEIKSRNLAATVDPHPMKYSWGSRSGVGAIQEIAAPRFKKGGP